ncbi:MAG: TolC family protein [Ignavibacteriales bacterium]|nr:TolC family protein [Ignavibacteriales bacterium]
MNQKSLTNKRLAWLCFALLSFILPAALHAQETLKLTLQDAIRIAVDKNWDMKMAGQDVKKAEEQINEAYSNAYPNLSFSGKYIRYVKLPVMFIPPNSLINPTSETQTFELGSDNSYDATVSLTQVLYSQKVNTAIKIADEYSQYSKTGLVSTKLQTVLSVKKAFYNILLMKDLLRVAKKSFESADANFRNVEALYKQGAASEFDLLRSDVQKANMQPMLIQTENNLNLAINYLKSLLSIGPDTKVDVEGSFTLEEVAAQEVEDGNANAVRNNPIVQQLQINESLLEKNIIIERSEYYPVLAAFGQYAWQTQDNTFKVSNYKWAESFFVGLQLSYNIFDGFKRGARIEQVKIDKDKVLYARKKLEEGLVIQFQQAQMKMEEAKKRIEAQSKSLAQADKAMAIAQTRYKNGIGTQLEIIDTQTAVVMAQTNYATAVYDYLTAKADWEYAVSKEQ